MTITNNIVAKLGVAFVTVAMLFTMVAPAQAQSASELQAMIDTLLKQVAALQAQAGGSTSASCSFTGALTIGSQGAQVTCLQQYLVANNYLVMPTGVSYGYFGQLTASAVAKWQAANGVSPAVGYFGPVSQAKFAAMGGGSTGGNNGGSNGGSTGGDLEGNAGSITVDDSSQYSSEEVGEGEEEVEVMEFSVEADDESDVEITSIKVELVESGDTSSEDLTDYAETISVWFGGDMVGEADAEDFSESSDVYTKTISLDGAVIRAGEEEDFVIAVTALNNLDSGDIDSDLWTVDVTNVRFVDGDGVTTTEDTDSDALEQTFNFTDFASAADVELKISLGDEEINDARVINIDANDVTDEVELLSFMAEAEGDSDITINDLPISVVSSADLNDTANTFYLFADGEEIASEATPSGATTTTEVLFEDVDFTIEAGDEVEFVVKADIKSTAGTLNDGATIQVIFGEAQTDDSDMDAEDESGEELGDTEMTGTATGDTHALYDIGFNAVLVSATESKTTTSDTSGVGDQGQFVIKYDVTAFDGDIYVDNTCTEDTDDSEAAAEGNSYTLTNPSSNSSTCVLTSTGDNASNSFLVEEGETETFTLTVNVTASADAFVQLDMTAIGWVPTTAGQGTQLYTFNLDEFESDPLFLNMF